MPLLIRKNGQPVWVPTSERQIRDGLRLCLEAGRVWSTTGLPRVKTVRVRPGDVVDVVSAGR